MSDSNRIFILFDDFDEYPIAGNIFLYCSDINQLGHLIQRYQKCQIVLVLQAKHIEELYNIMIKRCIDEIFILGDYARLNIKNKKVTIITTNERDLMFRILCTAARYTRRQVFRQRQLENYGVMHVLKTDYVKLLKQAKLFL